MGCSRSRIALHPGPTSACAGINRDLIGRETRCNLPSLSINSFIEGRQAAQDPFPGTTTQDFGDPALLFRWMPRPIRS